MADYNYDIDSESTNTVDIVGLDDVNTNSTVKANADLNTDNTIKADADLKLELAQPFKAETESALEIKPLELTIKPLKADLDLDTKSNLTLDLKPAVVDLCLTTNIGKVPNLCINLPYHHHIGFTWFGTEIWGYTFSGQQDMVVSELERQPKVVWGDTTQTGSPPHRAHKPAGPASRQAGGLRVRLGS
ncbi:MAG: hypothetical protein R3293_20875 [Candidatus Promineifilaceae bacterium]|nr:hypothetical protein [Candidatus Promineifilaceae bacterium]